MNWIEISGDLVKLSKESKFDIIIHGCNCQKVMGAGLAKEIKKTYPLAYEADKNFHNPSLGKYSVCNSYSECVIINAYTQIYPGKNKWGNDSDGNRYNAIKDVMRKINEIYKGKHIGVPQIGCGYGGLKWDIVKNILKSELKDVNVTIVLYK